MLLATYSTHNHCHTTDVAAPWSQRGAITPRDQIGVPILDRRYKS